MISPKEEHGRSSSINKTGPHLFRNSPSCFQSQDFGLSGRLNFTRDFRDSHIPWKNLRAGCVDVDAWLSRRDVPPRNVIRWLGTGFVAELKQPEDDEQAHFPLGGILPHPKNRANIKIMV
jgi:hypothetical protein